MSERRPPLWARGLARIVPADYRAEVLADLDDERRQRIAQGRSRLGSAMWLAGHLLRSAVASRRQEPVIMNTGSRSEILRGFPRELRRAARGLFHAPLFAGVAIAMIALGIGATTAIYTVLDAVVLRPLPYADPGRLVAVMHPTAAPGSGERKWGLSSAGYFEFKREVKSFSDMGSFRTSSYAVSGDNAVAEDARVGQVTASVFTTLGARPFRGRLINEDDDRPGATPVVVLGYAFWERRYGRDESILNRSIRTAGGSRLVVGVAEPGLSLPKPGPFASTANLTGFGVDIWEALRLDPNARPQNSHQYSGVARLKAGVTVAEAQAELTAITARFPDRFPTAYSAGFMKTYSFRVSVTPLHDEVLGPTVARSLWILFTAVGFVLLIACANVANLIIVRAAGRERETGIRSALGASRAHLLTQSLAESLVLTGAAGLGAIAIAYWGVPALIALAPTNIPLLGSSALDWRAVLFTTAVSAAAGVVFALIPLMRQPGSGGGVLGGTGRGLTSSRRQRIVRSGLVVGQVALAVLLLAAAGLLVRSVSAMKRVQPGLDPAGVLAFDMSLPFERYGQWQTAMNFHRELHDRLRAIPGVKHVGALSALPLRDIGNGCTVVFREARPFTKTERTPCVPTERATPGVFAALSMQVQGRVPTWQDVDTRSQAAVITRALADRLWPGEDPIGKGINSNGNPTAPPELWYRIVGVVPELRAYSLDGPPAEAVFYAATNLGQNDQADSMLELVYTVKTDSADPLSLVPSIRSIVSSLDNDVPVVHPDRMRDIVDRSMARASFVMLLLTIAACLAIVLSAVGLYGVIAYSVAERRVEIGIRMALGARVTQVGRRVVAQSVALAAAGAVVGAGLAMATTRVLDSYLFGVDPLDPIVLTVAVVTLLVVACAASAAPARRAARVNPVEAIRN